MKAAANINTPEQYLAAVAKERRAEMAALHKAIRSAAPKLKPSIQHGMLGYGSYHYKYASGPEG